MRMTVWGADVFGFATGLRLQAGLKWRHKLSRIDQRRRRHARA